MGKESISHTTAFGAREVIELIPPLHGQTRQQYETTLAEIAKKPTKTPTDLVVTLDTLITLRGGIKRTHPSGLRIVSSRLQDGTAGASDLPDIALKDLQYPSEEGAVRRSLQIHASNRSGFANFDAEVSGGQIKNVIYVQRWKDKLNAPYQLTELDGTTCDDVFSMLHEASQRGGAGRVQQKGGGELRYSTNVFAEKS